MKTSTEIFFSAHVCDLGDLGGEIKFEMLSYLQ